MQRFYTAEFIQGNAVILILTFEFFFFYVYFFGITEVTKGDVLPLYFISSLFFPSEKNFSGGII